MKFILAQVMLFIALTLPSVADVICSQTCENGEGKVSFTLANGSCPSPQMFYTCAPFKCDQAAVTCTKSCVDSDDCSSGAICESGKCFYPRNYCQSNNILKDPNGNLRNCSPFACNMGSCVTSCHDDGDCALGFRCDQRTFSCVR